ncbi:MAG TPA: helix-turn-helix domain-containing protein [Candidatus Thermoplasmatota archaeon]|nr:helix-turn-helix domain-containing protein [Candidatus Thermoplasmatota archaeon]
MAASRPRHPRPSHPPKAAAPAAARTAARAVAAQAPAARAAPPPEGECGEAADGCLGDLFALLSQSHMMQLLGLLIWRSKGPVRFVELQQALRISPNTLSARLKSLVEAGLVTRTPYGTIPPRVDYEATPKAHDLKHVFQTLHEWSRRHDLAPA